MSTLSTDGVKVENNDISMNVTITVFWKISTSVYKFCANFVIFLDYFSKTKVRN